MLPAAALHGQPGYSRFISTTGRRNQRSRPQPQQGRRRRRWIGPCLCQQQLPCAPSALPPRGPQDAQPGAPSAGESLELEVGRERWATLGEGTTITTVFDGVRGRDGVTKHPSRAGHRGGGSARRKPARATTSCRQRKAVGSRDVAMTSLNETPELVSTSCWPEGPLRSASSADVRMGTCSPMATDIGAEWLRVPPSSVDGSGADYFRRPHQASCAADFLDYTSARLAWCRRSPHRSGSRDPAARMWWARPQRGSATNVSQPLKRRLRIARSDVDIGHAQHDISLVM
jgi:hypothetical protein